MKMRGRALALLGGVLCAARVVSAQAAGQRQPTIDVVHYTFQITLSDTGRSLRGVGALLVRKARGVTSLPIDILLPVDTVIVDGVHEAIVRREGGILVPVDSAADTVRVAVIYHGAPADGLIISHDPAGRWQAFGDNWPNRGRDWLPLIDTPSDKATVRWLIEAPAGLTVVANGELEPGTTTIDRATHRALTTWWHWEESHPVPTYVMVIAAAPMQADTLRDTLGVHQRVWRSPDVAKTPAAFSEAPAIVGFYSSLIAPFPYERLDHLESSTRFGGMENATEIFYADQLFRRQTMSAGLIAHETAHQWFGDAVTEKRWPELWLSEGFATYFAELYREHSRGRDSLVAAMRAMREEILADGKSVPRRPVIDTIETEPLALLNVNSYQKGGYVLHMLRRLVGDSAFVQGLRAYWLAHRDGNATSDDLRAALERSSGRELGWFFEQWLRRPGYPELDVAWSYDRTARRVYLEVAQRPRFGSYRFPLVVAVTRSNGTTARSTIEVPATARTRLALPIELTAPPARVEIDPDADLLAAITEAHASRP